MEELYQSNLYLCVNFGKPGTTTHLLEVSACILMRVVISGFFRGKNHSKIRNFDAIVVKQKRKSVTKVICFQENVRTFMTFYDFSGGECAR